MDELDKAQGLASMAKSCQGRQLGREQGGGERSRPPVSAQGLPCLLRTDPFHSLAQTERQSSQVARNCPALERVLLKKTCFFCNPEAIITSL